MVPIPDNPHALRVASLVPGRWSRKGSLMRDEDGEVLDIDADTVRQAVMAVTGRLDSDAPPRRPQPSPGPVVLTLAEETPGEHQRRLYREAGVAFRGVNNSVFADVTPR